MTEDLIAALGSMYHGITVLPWGTVQGMTRDDPYQIGRSLKVDYVMSGSIRDDVVVFDLYSMQSRDLQFSASYNTDTGHPIANVARKLGVAIDEPSSIEADLAARHTENPAARQAYYYARLHYNRHNRNDILKSIDFYEQAVQLDPNYGAAYAGLAEAHIVLGRWFDVRPVEAYQIARRFAQQAIALDPYLGEPHTALGFIAHRFDWDLAEAERQFQASIKLNPSYETAYHWYAVFLANHGRFKEAREMIGKASRLEPTPMVSNAGAWIEYLAGNYEESLRIARAGLEYDKSMMNYIQMGLCELELDQDSEALEHFQLAVDLSDREPVALCYLCYAFGLAGKRTEAQSVLADIEAIMQDQYVQPYYVAIAHVGLGNTDEVFRLLGQALQDRAGELSYLRVEPAWKPLREDRRLLAILERMGLNPVWD